MGGSNNAEFHDRLYANKTYDWRTSGNAYGNHNCDMDSATVEGRDEPGRNTHGEKHLERVSVIRLK